MSKLVKITLAASVAATLGACARQPEPSPVLTGPSAVTVEPTYGGKLG